jgi:hypothetical protein
MTLAGLMVLVPGWMTLVGLMVLVTQLNDSGWSDGSGARLDDSGWSDGSGDLVWMTLVCPMVLVPGWMTLVGLMVLVPGWMTLVGLMVLVTRLDDSGWSNGTSDLAG